MHSPFYHVKLPLGVEIVVGVGIIDGSTGLVGEAEVVGRATGLLQVLGEHFVAPQFGLINGATSESHGLLKVSPGEARNRVLPINVHGIGTGSNTSGDTGADLCRLFLDALADTKFAGTLTYFGNVSTREAIGDVGQMDHVNILGDGGLAEGSPEDGQAGLFIGEGDVDELIKTTRTQEGRVNLVRSVGGSNDKDILLCVHPVHLGQDLVEDPVSTTTVTCTGPARLGDRVKFVEEEHTGRSSTGLVEELADIGFGFTKPHGEQFGSLHRDEIGLALIGNSLGQQSLTTPGRSIEQHT